MDPISLANSGGSYHSMGLTFNGRFPAAIPYSLERTFILTTFAAIF
jgi:hypothetical protein